MKINAKQIYSSGILVGDELAHHTENSLPLLADATLHEPQIRIPTWFN